jgi:hypothetical protein
MFPESGAKEGDVEQGVVDAPRLDAQGVRAIKFHDNVYMPDVEFLHNYVEYAKATVSLSAYETLVGFVLWPLIISSVYHVFSVSMVRPKACGISARNP